MKIGQKIILYFSTVTIAVVGLFFLFIYTVLAEYREKEFQQRLKDKTITTLRFLAEAQQIDHDVLQTMDRFVINKLYQEKILLFDEHKKLIYSGIDDTKIIFSKTILEKLSPKVRWVESTENNFDVVGVYLNFQNKSYYGITKAYDNFGLSKLNYLRNVLIITFLALTIIIVIITYYISRQISRPLNEMAAEINTIKFDSGSTYISVPETGDEIQLLARQFNDLMKRLHNAFSFQKHAIHHISHELKTPIAILVSNFEKIERENDITKIKSLIKIQKEDTKDLSDIINALLEISKTETGNTAFVKVRVDDLVYDMIEEIKKIHTDFNFEVEITGNIKHENDLTVLANKRLLISAFTNLMINCVQHNETNKAKVRIKIIENKIQLEFINKGETIQPTEIPFLFQHFFRGSNSKGKRGFGLGLVLVNKIIQLHKGTVQYSNFENTTNIFKLMLPLKID